MKGCDFIKLSEAIEAVKPLDKGSMERAKKRFKSIAIPLGSLGLLEADIIRLAGMLREWKPEISKRAAVVFCADNGVVAQGVTQCGQEVTAIVTENIARGESTVCLMAKRIGMEVIPVDIGVARDVKGEKIICRKLMYGTKDMTNGPAMTGYEAELAIETGISIAEELAERGFKLLCAGEMGIGNTTTAAAVTSVLLNKEPEEVTGRGAGLSSEGLRRKKEAIKSAIELNRPNAEDPVDVLSKVGGLDICGMAGLYIGGAAMGIPVVVDGVISCTAALIAERLCPKSREYMIFSHESAEPAGAMLLKELRAEPYIKAGLRLGEGTGGVAAVAVLDLALAVYNGMSSFEEIGMEAYEELK